MTFAAAIVIFAAQAAFLGADEFFFHRGRALPRWERLGHPLDTASVLMCLGLALAAPPAGIWIRLYAAAAVLSCLLVTKDEWVHAGRCAPAEHWLHACLFLLHPVLLFAAFLLWRNGQATGRLVLACEAALAAAFAAYQGIYWNTAWLRSPR